MHRQPCDFVIECFSEVTAAVCPGDILSEDTMLRTFDPLRCIADQYRNTVDVRRSPGRFLFGILGVVTAASSAALWTDLLAPFERLGMNDDSLLFDYFVISADWNSFSFVEIHMHFVECQYILEYTQKRRSHWCLFLSVKCVATSTVKESTVAFQVYSIIRDPAWVGPGWVGIQGSRWYSPIRYALGRLIHPPSVQKTHFCLINYYISI